MKRYLIALAASALMSAPALLHAQSTTQAPPAPGDHRWGGPGGRGPGMMHMYDQLNLTDAQKAQIKSIHEKYRAQMPRPDTAAMRAQREQMRARMQAARPIMEKERGEIRAVLNADQQKKFDAMQAQMKQRMQERGAPPAHN